MQKPIISAVKMILAAIAAFAMAPQAFGVANYVYHERTGNDPGCGGQYVSVLNPSSAQAHPLRFKVEYQFFTDTTKVYYTIDGSAPSGSKGVASGTTLIADGAFVCTFGSPMVDVWTASIPAQPAGTVVKYIVGAWHSGAGDEIFANSGTCEGCGNFNNSSLATVFQYTVGSTTELYWDSNGATAGAGATPAGIWGTDDFWSSVLDGTAATGAWIADRDAIFSAGTDASGAFTVTVTGTQSANRVRVEEGMLSLSGGTLSLTGAGEVNVASGLSTTIGSIVGGAVGLTKAGPGTLVLGGANTYSGNTKVNAGTLDFTTDGNLGAAPGAFTQDSVQLSDSTLRFSGTAVITLHANRGFTLGGSGATIDCAGLPGILFIPNIIDGAGTTLTKTGNGELGLYGASNKFAKLVIDQGVLRFGQSTFNGYDETYGAVPAVFTADAITIRNGATNRTVGGIGITNHANRGITLGPGGGVFRNDVQPYTVNGAITGPGGLRKEGARNLTLNGNNTYQGETVLNGGTLSVLMTFNGYNETPGALTMNSGRLLLSNYNNFASVAFNGGRIDVNTNGCLGSGVITITPNSTTAPLLVNSASHGPTTNITLNNDIVLNAGLADLIDISANSGRELVLNGKVSGASRLIKNNSASTGALVLGNENNDFSGSNRVFAGTLIASANNALGAPTEGTRIDSGASLAFRGGINYSTPELVSISGVGRLSGGAISNDSGNNTFSGPVMMYGSSSIGVNVDQLTLTGVIGETAGTHALTKVGASRLVLTAANTYSGGTIIDNGILHAANLAGSATGPGPITINANGTLTGPGSVAGTLTVNGTISPGASPGTQNTGSEIWNGGGSYLWEINDVDAATGADPGWDLINITGGLTINATSGSKFNIKITSLTLANAAGNVHDFSDANDYVWTILTTTTGITGFDAAAFNLDLSGFSNPIGSGEFRVATANAGNDLVLQFVHPPVIAAGPVGGTAECGSTFNFSVTATGSAPLAYQWKHAGTNLPGANAATLSVTASAETAGSYAVEVSNAHGTATGGPVTLVVEDTTPPSIVCAPNGTVECGAPWDFTDPTASDVCSGTNVTVTVMSTVTNSVTGGYAVTRTWQATDQANLTATCNQVITVLDTVAPALTCPSDVSVCTSSNSALVEFTPVTTDACDATPNVICNPPSGTEFLVGTNQVSCTATDDAGNSTNCTFTVTVLQNTTATGPADSSVCTGGSVTLSTTASGTGPFTYQWRKGGEEMVNETNSSITITGAGTADATNYCVEVTGACNSVTNCANVTLIDLVSAEGPTNTTACTGTSVTLSTTASGAGPFTYQWRKDGDALANETNSSLTLASVAAGDMGNYCVEVTGACDSVTNCATLSINPLPNVSVNSATICTGQSATLTATTDASNPSYLWSPGGETTPSITVSPTATATYSVTVTDGTTTCSAGASGTVTVNPLPNVSVNSATICTGQSATLTATTDASNPSYLWSPGGETTPSITVSPTATTTYSVTVTDGTTTCSAGASGTVTVNPLPNVSVNSPNICAGGSAVLTATTDASNPSFLWSPGGQTTASITVSPASTTTYTCTVTDGNTTCSASASGTVTVHGFDAFANTGTITINDLAAGSPYPSTIAVSGLTATVCRVTVTLHGLSHDFPDDLDLALMGPDGTTILLMSDVGNGFGLSGATLTFDDLAGSSLPDATQIMGGTYKPTNFGAKSDGNPDNFPAPAPTIRYGTNLALFNGINPNGTWSLFAFDDELVDAGQIAGGWSLSISTLDPIADVAVTQLDVPDPVAVGSNLTYTVVVDNHGPALATGVLLSDTPPAGATLVSFGASQGSCTLVSGTIWCELGSIAPGSSATLTVVVSASATGTLVNTASVQSDAIDFNTANNSSSASTTVLNPPVITTGPQSQTVCAGSTVTFTVTATGEPPLSYQWYFGPDAIPGATSDTLTINNAQPPASGSYTVVVSNTVGADSDSANLTVNPLPIVTVASHTICRGSSTNLTAVNNAASPSYLWSPGGETTQTITVSPTTTTTYTVVVTDGVTGCSNSASATVIVNDPTTATSLTSVSDACPGTSVTFSTTAGGTGPHTYVWRKDGNVIAGANGPSYTIASVATGDAGTYCVDVTGYCNTATQCATLTVATPPAITSQPVNQTTPMGNSATFSVTATGTAPLSYQWRENGVDIAGATGTSYTVNPASFAQNGNVFSVVVSNCAGSVVSAGAVLTVTPITGISFDFNTPGQFTNTPYNVQLNDWLHMLLPSQLIETRTGGVGGGGGLDVTGTADYTSTVHPVSYDFSLDGRTLYVSVMVRIAAPTQNNRNTQIGFITTTNGYVGTAPGITPSGYTDPSTNGFMSVILQSTAQPALTYQLLLQHRRPDGGITTVTPSTATATLTAGNWYKLVGVFRNIKATAANTFSVEASLQDMGANGLTPGAVVTSYTPTNIVNTSIPNQRNLFLAIRTARSDTGADFWDNIQAYTRPGPIAFVAQPASQTLSQGQQASWQALVDGEGPYTYQWNRNGSPIPGAGNWKYMTEPLRLSENGDQYTVTVTGPDGTTITSDPATVTVQAHALAVVSVGSVDGCSVGVQFNQSVDAASASNPANYLINGSPAGSARVYTSRVDLNPTRVVITPSATLSGPFTVTVQNVNDLSGNPIGAANSASGAVAGLTGVDINPLVAAPAGENYSFGPGQFEVLGGGTDIFTAPDSFRYVYTQKAGDFDVKIRVPYQDVMRQPTKTGFDVRVSLDPAAPHVLAAVNPKWPARGLYEGTHRQVYNVGGTSWGATGTAVRYPDAWLRFRRVGNTFMRYSSQNGTTWQFDGQFSPSPVFPETVYLGLAVCAVANANPQLASFDNFGDFAGYPGATIAITTQPVPSATVAAGSSSNLSVTATITGAPAGELSYVWQRHAGGGVWTNVVAAGQTNNVFNTGALFAADNGAEYRVIVRAPGAAEVTSSTTMVTVTDGAGPTVTAASIPVGGNAHVLVTFSEPVSSATALSLANYTLTNLAGNVAIASATFFGADQRNVLLTTANQLPPGGYGLRIGGIQDLAGNNINPNPTHRTFSQVGNAPVIGPVYVEFYSGLSNAANLGDLDNPGTKFANDTPDFVVYSNVFGINPVNANFPATLDHYGVQMYALFVPPTTGAYKFYVRADDFAQFRMNTNNTGDSTSPAGAVAQVTLTANAQAYTLANSVTNNLIGGRQYYIELRFKESTGGDGGTVAVRTDNTVPNQGEVIPLAQLAFPAAIAKPTPVAVELYTGLVTVNSILPNALGVAFQNGGYPDLLAALSLPQVIARNPNVLGYSRYFGFNTNLAQINATFDNYLGRIYGNFVAPSNGLYKFYMRSDDSSELWMNTNAVNSTDPAGMTLLGIIDDFYSVNQTLVAQNVYLNGGQRYYMEGRWREGTGGDGMTVAVRAQGDLTIPPNAEVIPGSMLEFPASYDKVGATDGTISPVNPVVSEGGTITFQARDLRGQPPYTIQWLKNGVPVAANTFSFVTQPLTMSDNGATFTLVVNNAFSRVERSTTVTVLDDNTAPTLLGAVGSQYQDLVVLSFSEPLEVAAACSTPNYQISGGVQVYSASIDQSTRQRVTLRTSPQTAGTTYTVTLNNVRDAAGNTIAANTMAAFTAWIAAGKGFYVEIYTNIAGTAVQNLIFDNKYINNLADISYYTNRLGAGLLGQFGNDTMNNYGVRITGLLSVPTNGLYRLYVRGDDGTMIFMNTNGPDASGRVLVARNDGANSGTWENGTGGSFTPILTLDANTLYFTEVFMKEGGGGDHLEVMLRAIDPTTLAAVGGVPAPSVNDIVPGDFFVALGNPDRAALTVTEAPPADLDVVENDTVTLRARAHAPNFELSQATGYRWQAHNGTAFVNIPGALGPTLTFVAPAFDQEYRVIISGPGTNAVYTTALHSTADAKGPVMLTASSLNATNLDICFNEPVDLGSGTDPFNYSVNGGSANISGITLREDPRKVTITVDAPVSSPFVIEAFSIHDLASPQNSGDSVVTGRVSNAYVALDVGTPVAPGSSFSCGDGEIDVVAGGNDIWGASDVGHLTMTQVTGDFDVHVRLEGLTRPDPIAKAGLMIRDSLDAGSRTLHVLGNPAQYQPFHAMNPGGLTGRDLGEAAQRFAANDATPGTAGWQARPESTGIPSQLGNSGFAPVGIPNAWFRMKRQGSLFSSFHSYDGVNWRMFAQSHFTYPRTVYLGFGTTAHTAAQAANLVTVANYRDIYIPPPPIILVQPSPATQTAPLHSSVTYSVVASNPPPNRAALSYQWFRNGLPISGATSDTLTISDAKVSDAGVYTVDVSNDGGATTSVPVTLNVDSGLVANTDSLNTVQNQGLTVSAASLLANDSAASGETPTIVAVSGVFPASFVSDFDSGIPAGATLYGANGGGLHDVVGGVDNSGVLKLTLNTTDDQGALVINELALNRRVTAFNASFMLRIGDASGEPADGFSFNFAPDLPNAPSAGAENGVGSGFSFCVDNYRFHPYPQGGIVNSSGMKIRYRGVDVAGVRMPTWNSPRFVPVSISVTAGGLMTVIVDGTNVFGNITLPNYVPLRGRFGLHARNGGEFASQWVDNLSITSMLTIDTTREPAVGIDGERILGTARIAPDGYLHVTDALGSQQGAFQTAILNTQAMTSLSASFMLRIGGSSTPARAADGMSLSIAPDLPNASFGEEGAGNYLTVCLDTWDNNGTDTAPSFDIKFGGIGDANIIATKSFQPAAPYLREGGRPPHAEIIVDGSSQPLTLGTDVGGVPTFAPVTLNVDSDGTLDLTYKGVTIFQNLAIPGFYGATNLRVGLGGRTGGATDNHWVDDLSVTINTAEGPVVYNNDFSTVPPSPYGTVVLSGSQVVYTPPANVCGVDTFYYLMSSESGGTAIGRVDVTIAEGTPTPPTITACASNRTLAASANCQVALPDLTAEVRTLDNCCCPAVTQNPPPGTMLGRGTHTVTFTATDSAGLTAQCQATITVTDQTAPVITLVDPGPVTIECHSNTPIPGATAQDDCDGDLTSAIVVGGSVDRNVPGIYVLTYDVSDTAGNAAQQVQRQVNVVDTTPPSITCPANITTPCTSPVVTWTVTVSDVCDASASATCTPPSGSTFPIGNTVVNCVATDASGNTNACSFTVTVEPDAAPALTIQLVSTNSVRITWPKTCVSYQLQQSPSIGSDANWVPAPGTPTLNGDTYELIVPTDDEDTLFFRLRSVSPTAAVIRERDLALWRRSA